MGQAYLEFGIKFVLFAAVALCGIFFGIRLRKAKDKKEAQKENDLKGTGYNE